MTDMELDGMMRRVLLDALRYVEEDWGADCVFIPSKNHLRQMKLMLKDPLKWMRNRSKPVWKVIVQKVAIILLVLSLGFGSVMVVSPAARAAVKRWVMEIYETHITYRFSGEPISGPMPQYIFSEIPDGFVEMDCFENDAYVSLFYQGQDGDVLCLDYVRMQEGVGGIVTTQNNVADVTVNGMEGQIFLPTATRGQTTVIWIDPLANIQFLVDSSLPPDVVMELAESVCLAKDEK